MLYREIGLQQELLDPIEPGQPDMLSRASVQRGLKPLQQQPSGNARVPRNSPDVDFTRRVLTDERQRPNHMQIRDSQGVSGLTGDNLSRRDQLRPRGRFGNGHTLAYKISPPQKAFAPAQVLSGVTRPHRATNLWVSDPNQPLPQWLELSWPKARTIREVQLVFPGHLVREYHAYGPFYRDPQCLRDYAIEVLANGNWTHVLEVNDNYQRLRRHTLPAPVSTDKLRVIVTATNGAPSVAIYEIRCNA